MAWPKKGTRKLTVDGISYLWHSSPHCPCCSYAAHTVGMPGHPYVLHIDPLPHDFELTPQSFANAIKWAVANDWSPDRGPTRAMAFDESLQDFVWLPEGVRHLSDLHT